jgi:hypothetical protein
LLVYPTRRTQQKLWWHFPPKLSVSIELGGLYVGFFDTYK